MVNRTKNFNHSDVIICLYLLVKYFGLLLYRSGQPAKDGSESWSFNEEDWKQLNRIIGYKEGEDDHLMEPKGNVLYSLFEVYMRRNASKLVGDNQKCLAELSCDALVCSTRLYEERKIFDLKLGSYRLNSPNGLLAEVWMNLHLCVKSKTSLAIVLYASILAEC